MPVALPRHGFLHASRSAPVLGPGLGRPTSARIVTSIATSGPGKYYDEVNPRLYRKTNGNLCANLNSPGKRIVPLNPPTEGADAMYDTVPLEKYKETDKSFRFDKAFRFDKSKDVEYAKFLKHATKHYTLPAPEVYKERMPTTPKWRPTPARFPRPPKPGGADAFYEPSLARVTSVPTLGGGGPRIDKNMYRCGAGADTFYDLPNPTVYKERSSSFRFGRDETAPASASDCAPRHRPAPLPPQKKVDPDAPKPAWVDRLTVHKPRPTRPFLRSPRPSSAPQAKRAK